MFAGGGGGGYSDGAYGGDDYGRRRNPSDQFARPIPSINESSTPSVSLKTQLINQTLNFHGQQLTSFMREKYGGIDLKTVDYHLYQQRSRELKLEDRGKRLLLHRFIAQKSDELFEGGGGGAVRTTLENDHTEDHSALLPPLETFGHLNESIKSDDRLRHFFNVMSVGDTLFCRVQHKAASGLILNLVALDPLTGKSRYVEDMRIKGFCPSAEMVPAADPRDSDRNYENGDIVRVAILELKPESERFLAGMKTESLPADLQNIIKLGLAKESELPSTLKYSRQAIERGYLYEDFLEKSVGFINPNNVEHLCTELGLDNKSSSLIEDLDGNYPAKHYSAYIRKAQNSKWAYKHVHLGIKHFKANNKIEAFQCLNQALNIDPINVEGLVARGALYANNNGLEKAIDDFEAALKINPGHVNAKKYLCETLIAVGRNHEDDKNFTMALETYERIVSISPDHKEANDSIFYLKGRPKDVPIDSGGPSIPGLDSDTALYSKDKLKFMLDGDKDDRGSARKEKKKKRRRSRTSESESGDSSDSEERRRKKKRRKDKRRSGSFKRSKSRSVSPLSKRAAMQNNRPISPFSAKLNPGMGMNLPGMNESNLPGMMGDVGMNVSSGYNEPAATRPHQMGNVNPPEVISLPQQQQLGRSDRSQASADGRASPRGDAVSVISNSGSVAELPVPLQTIDMSRPPPLAPGHEYLAPGYPPPMAPAGYGYVPPSKADEEYNDKVAWFLKQTNSAPVVRGYSSRGEHDRYDRSRRDDRQTSSHRRSDSRGRRRSRDRRSESRDKRRSGSREVGRSGSRGQRSQLPREHDNRDIYRSEKPLDRDKEKERDTRTDNRDDRANRYHGDDRFNRSRGEDRMDRSRDEDRMDRSRDEDRMDRSRDDEDDRAKREGQVGVKKKMMKEETEEVVVEERESKKIKKEKRMSSKKSLSPLLDIIKDEELKKKLQEHLSTDSTTEKKKKKKKEKERSRSTSRTKKDKKKSKLKVKEENDTVEISSSDDEGSKKKKKKRKDSPPKRKDPSPSRKETSRRKDSSPRQKESPRRDDSPRKKDSSRRKESPAPQKRKKEVAENVFDRADREKSEKDVYNKQLMDYIEKGSVFQRLNPPPKPKSGGGLWIPTGEDSLTESISKAVSHVEAAQKKMGKFDPHKKISMSSDAPPPARDYDVTYDPKIGMYIRVPKQAPPEPTPPTKPTKAEKIAMKKSRMDEEKDKDGEVQAIEERIIRSVGSPRRSVSRGESKNHGSSEKRRRSRSRSNHRDRRSRSRDRRRSRERHRDPPSSEKKDEGKRGDGKKYDYDSQITDMREETERLRIEREAIEREKAQLIAAAKKSLAPAILDPVAAARGGEFSGLENVLNTVLEAVSVGDKDKGERRDKDGRGDKDKRRDRDDRREKDDRRDSRRDDSRRDDRRDQDDKRDNRKDDRRPRDDYQSKNKEDMRDKNIPREENIEEFFKKSKAAKDAKNRK